MARIHGTPRIVEAPGAPSGKAMVGTYVNSLDFQPPTKAEIDAIRAEGPEAFGPVWVDFECELNGPTEDPRIAEETRRQWHAFLDKYSPGI